MYKLYKSVEITVKFVNGVAVGEENTRLTTQLAQVEPYSPEWNQLHTAQLQFIKHDNMVPLNCLANYVPGLAENTTIVHIPNMSMDGKRLEFEHIQAIFWQVCADYGVVHYTQSSVKERTLYMVKPLFWHEFSRLWTDAYKWSNYAPLVFSSMTDEEITEFMIYKMLEANELDGNGGVDPIMWGYAHSCQGRWMQLDGSALRSIGKGTGNPRKGIKSMELNANQVKFTARTGKGKWLMLKNTNINSKKNKTWLAPQIPLMLEDCPETRQWLRSRVKNAIKKEILSTLNNPLQKALRRGALKVAEIDGKPRLEAPRSAQEEAFRCNIENCIEIEQRSGRFLVRDAATIALAGGVYGERSLITISNEFGAHMITREEALDLHEKGRKVFMLYRDPVNGPKRIVFLDKDPYREGQGFVIDAETAAVMNADSDGDTGNLVSDGKVVAFYAKYLRKDLDVNVRPTPLRRAAPLTIENLEDIALTLMRNAWVIGTTTILSWKLLQAGETKAGATALLYADTAPMIIKHKIFIDGKPFMSCVQQLLERYRDILEDTTLQWHEAMEDAQEWDSVRQFADSKIKEPITHMDEMWNAAAEQVDQWLKANPLYELSLSRIGHTIFNDHGRIPAYNWSIARDEFITPWGVYWAQFIREDGTFVNANHKDFFDKIHEKAKSADIMTLAAIMCWRPLNGANDGFGLKWHALFATGRAHELLGYHPEIKKYMKHRYDIDLAQDELLNHVLLGAPTITVEL